MNFSTYIVSRIFGIMTVVGIVSLGTVYAQGNTTAQLVYDPVTNSFTIVAAGQAASGGVVSGSALGAALTSSAGSSSASTTGVATTASAGSSAFGIRNITLTVLQPYVEKLRSAAEAGFASVDAKIASTHSRVYGENGLQQQREVLACLDTSVGTTFFDVDDHFKKLKGIVAEKSSQVLGYIVAHDQKIALGAIVSGSVEDILGRKSIESEIALFQASIPILTDAYVSNATTIIQTEEKAMQDAVDKNKLNIETYTKRESSYDAIEKTYNELFKQVGADQTIVGNIEIFNILADQTTSFYLTQYQKYLDENFLMHVTIDSIGKNALQPKVDAARLEAQKIIGDFSRQQLNKSYPADTLQGILESMTKLRAAYTNDGKKACRAFMQDNTIETLGPDLQKTLATMLNNSATITSKVSSGTNRSQIRVSYMEAMQSFYDDNILGDLFKEQTAELNKLITSYGGVVVKSQINLQPRSVQALDLVKRVLIQKYLEYLAKGQVDTFSTKIDTALQRLDNMKQADDGSRASLLKLVDEGISYVRDEFLEN